MPPSPRTALATLPQVFGRSSAHVDIVVRHESISRQHAAILHAEKDSYLIDLGSASGSFIDGERVPSKQTRQLRDGAVITLGDCRASYTLVVTKPAAGAGGQKRKR